MSFLDHLEELRARLIRCIFVFMIGFGLCYWISDHILMILKKPLFDALPPEQHKLYFTSLFENFLTHLKISGYASLFFFSPYYFSQLWGFIAPGLYEKERKLAFPFIAAATTFFLGGAAFAYFVLFPAAFKFFVTYGSESDVPMLTIGAYYDTALKLLLLFGAAFELPVLVVLLGYLGVVDAATLRANRRNAIMGITIACALFAPPDAMSMVILMAPLILMFEAAIYVVAWIGVRKQPETAPTVPDEPNPLQGKSQP